MWSDKIVLMPLLGWIRVFFGVKLLIQIKREAVLTALRENILKKIHFFMPSDLILYLTLWTTHQARATSMT